jgi:hypothetical protein
MPTKLDTNMINMMAFILINKFRLKAFCELVKKSMFIVLTIITQHDLFLERKKSNNATDFSGKLH